MPSEDNENGFVFLFHMVSVGMSRCYSGDCSPVDPYFVSRA